MSSCPRPSGFGFSPRVRSPLRERKEGGEPGPCPAGRSGEPTGTGRQEGGWLGCAPAGRVSAAGPQPLRQWLADSLSGQRGATSVVTEVWDGKHPDLGGDFKNLAGCREEKWVLKKSRGTGHLPAPHSALFSIE